MKILLALTFILFSVGKTFGQCSNLENMNQEQRENYLIATSNEVIKTFGPDYYRDNQKPTISGPEKFCSGDKRTEIAKNVGREYYIITYPYDKSKETLDFDFSSEVKIWKDTGEPLDVTFGNGHGKSFLFIPYKQQKMLDVNDKVPYQQAIKPDTNIWQKEDK